MEFLSPGESLSLEIYQLIEIGQELGALLSHCPGAHPFPIDYEHSLKLGIRIMPIV